MRLLRWFGIAWLGLVALLVVISMVSMLVFADSLWQGIRQIQDTWSPFNVANFVVTVAIAAPGFGALWLEDYLQNHRDSDVSGSRGS